MGCCLFASVLGGLPRLALFIWWLMNPARFSNVFDTILLPLIGLLFLPWTTLAYVFVAPAGISTFEWILLAFAVLADLGAWGGGSQARRRSR